MDKSSVIHVLELLKRSLSVEERIPPNINSFDMKLAYLTGYFEQAIKIAVADLEEALGGSDELQKK